MLEQEQQAVWDQFYKEMDDLYERYRLEWHAMTPVDRRRFTRERDRIVQRLVKSMANVLWKRAELSTPGAR